MEASAKAPYLLIHCPGRALDPFQRSLGALPWLLYRIDNTLHYTRQSPHRGGMAPPSLRRETPVPCPDRKSRSPLGVCARRKKLSKQASRHEWKHLRHSFDDSRFLQQQISPERVASGAHHHHHHAQEERFFAAPLLGQIRASPPDDANGDTGSRQGRTRQRAQDIADGGEQWTALGLQQSGVRVESGSSDSCQCPTLVWYGTACAAPGPGPSP
ncbi:hypothetical protein CSOJ01_14629 [Colletotrichum sojae]|uniref:Uncharacterized protein n=1 Tax=Colletotrichum sojae TaxID=2175907 RepID=A0A8H6IQ23_9PEZI|nr:hypothetical protein CSOJ01_14629 [Colletotrichum sojae]